MRPRSTLKHTLVAALAASALVASPALARQVDRADRYDAPTSSLAGTTTPHQDLRGERALDAAYAAEHQFLPNQPTWPTHPAPVPKPVKVVPATTSGSDDSDLWLALGIGLAGAGIVGGSAVAVTRRQRVRTRRATA
jgi:hypothetical protein